ncbi:alpha-1,3-mannosyltransferase [Sporothrix schenckii 1099-18]|uniref:Alpha-1,3-mannosyltransferase n=1 Tax=Sporothrix schenckii 1099-18 TaxID=1397361 RepID=A0A0F2M388_SPOSC|nr:alpha-1,3-mannosyltransferase [Sporothrix schenckii 1099-18]KJR84178.1 alpha-1,3-mannosyltransferase [Sporothrix schenckii 1099-18]
MRRKYLFVGQVLLLLLVVGALYYGSHHITRLPASIRLPNSESSDNSAAGGTTGTTETSYTYSGILSAENITRYVNSIFDAKSEDLPRLKCPDIPSPSRYDSLKSSPDDGRQIKYYFAIDLRDTVPLLPRLLGSVVETIKFLGPASCALSIVEGNSHDGTYDILQAIRASFNDLDTTYFLRSSAVDPKEGDRIAKLAELRNLALQPLLDGNVPGADQDTTVVFLNDVAACTEDILELVHQRRRLGADMTCGLDWVYVGRDPTFYDVWVARGMNGDSFFEIPPDGNWNSAWNLFWNNDAARASLAAHRPFQVFSCWNGAAVFAAKPLLDAASRIRFRGPRDGECSQGEPELFCKDMWFHGYGKIAVVPSVNLEYSDANAQRIKDLKGYTSRWTAEAGDEDDEDKIAWQTTPPETVKCIPSYDSQSFRPWNETLG